MEIYITRFDSSAEIVDVTNIGDEYRKFAKSGKVSYDIEAITDEDELFSLKTERSDLGDLFEERFKKGKSVTIEIK